MSRAQGQSQPLPGSDSKHDRKPNAVKEGEAKGAEGQTRHMDEARGKELVPQMRTDSGILLRLLHTASWGLHRGSA